MLQRLPGLTRVLSRPLARAALRPLSTAAEEIEPSFSLALSEEQQAFKELVRRCHWTRLPPSLPQTQCAPVRHGRRASLRRRK